MSLMTAESDFFGDAQRHRAPRISEADVFRAADELLMEGHRPTIDRVRMRLGRGSPNTINGHLDAWWLRLGSRVRDLSSREFPQVPEHVAGSLQQLWNQALGAAHEAMQGELAARATELSGQETVLNAQRIALAHEMSEVAARAAAVDESLSLARDQLAEVNRHASSLEEALRARDRAEAQLRARVEQLEREQKSFVGKLESERVQQNEERARLEARHEVSEKRWLTENDLARRALEEVLCSSQLMRNTLESVVRERDHVRTELEQLKAVPESPRAGSRVNTRGKQKKHS